MSLVSDEGAASVGAEPMSAADQVGAVIAFSLPFFSAYVVYRVIFWVLELKDRRRARAERFQQQLKWDRFVALPLSWIMLEDALDTYRLASLEEWRKSCR
jgi:hypothetical protein